MRRKKFLAIVTTTMMTFAMLCSSVGTATVNAAELETTGMELLVDDTAALSVDNTVDKNVVETAITLESDPTISTYATGDNTELDGATVITVNSLQFDKIAEEGQARWYLFQTSAGKLTLDLTTPNSTNVDYDVYLYQYDDAEGMINLIGGSENVNTAEEHFAMLVEEGIYFILVNGYSGYDATNDYQLGVGYSSTYDTAEIDDTLSTSKVVTTPFSVTGTIDNTYDYDFIKFTLTQSGAVTLSLKNNGSTSNIYRMDLYNGSGTAIGYLTQGQTGRATLVAGNYYIRTRATTYGGDSTSTYTLTGSFATAAARVNVTSAGNAFIDYGQGKFWRIDGSATITGTAYDSDGNLIPNANIEIKVPVVVGNTIKTASGTTDSQGNFSITLNLGSAAGQNQYDTGVSYHYYDVVPIYFYSNGTQITSNISYIYHFAYSSYHPF